MYTHYYYSMQAVKNNVEFVDENYTLHEVENAYLLLIIWNVAPSFVVWLIGMLMYVINVEALGKWARANVKLAKKCDPLELGSYVKAKACKKEAFSKAEQGINEFPDSDDDEDPELTGKKKTSKKEITFKGVEEENEMSKEGDYNDLQDPDEEMYAKEMEFWGNKSKYK